MKALIDSQTLKIWPDVAAEFIYCKNNNGVRISDSPDHWDSFKACFTHETVQILKSSNIFYKNVSTNGHRLELDENFAAEYYSKFNNISGVSAEWCAILSAAVSFGEKEEVIIISSSWKLRQIASKFKIPTISLFNIERNLRSPVSAILDMILGKKPSYLFIILNLLTTILFIILLFSSSIRYEVNKYIRSLFSGIPNNFFTVLICLFCSILIGTFLFYFRERRRLFYGILELSFGATSVTWLVVSNTNLTDISFYVTLFGGFYIIVRGWDNIYKATQNSSIGFWMQNIFNGKSNI